MGNWEATRPRRRYLVRTKTGIVRTSSPMSRLERTPPNPSCDIFVNQLAVENPKDPDLGSHNLIHDPIIPDTKLPIPLQRPRERRPVLLGCNHEAKFECAGDSTLNIKGRLGQVLFHQFRMVDESKRHSVPRPCQAGPDSVMGQGLRSVEGAFSFLCKANQHTIFLGRQGLLDQIPHLERKGYPIPLGPPSKLFIQRVLKNHLHSGVLRPHVSHLQAKCNASDAPQQVS